MTDANDPVAGTRGRVLVGGIQIDLVTEQQVVGRVVRQPTADRGGVIVTPNVDIWRRVQRDDLARSYVERADLVVADGQPLVWAAALVGTPVPERVTGSSLVETLCAGAAVEGRSVFLLGGGTGDSAAKAARALPERHPGLVIAGTLAPQFGFEKSDEELAAVADAVATTRPDIVLVGLGFPKQEGVAFALRERLPGTWFLGCGGAIEMAAGEKRRSPRWAQRLGVEWLVRLAQDPSRLARRYLVDDIPAAIALLGASARQGWQNRRGRSR